MATATVTRPTQALRNRRDAPRPSTSKRQANVDGTAVEPASKKRKLAEPFVRDSQYILNKHQGKQPSLTVHLYDTTFRFEGQDTSWTYDSPMSCVIRHLKNQTVPHELMEELLSPAIQWYDGCLIVEIQNHRAKAGKEKGWHDSAASDGYVKFGMHNYTPHITPSPMVPYPSKAMHDESPDNGAGGSSSSSSKKNNDAAAAASTDMPAPERPKEKDGPIFTTVVLHPTQLSQHHEMLILMKTPADQVRSKKRGGDGATPSSAQPPTPQLSVPPTPLAQTSRGPLSQSQKMCLEDGDLYTFQADLLVATEPPLLLDPVTNPQDAERILDVLQHPLHQAKAPSLKTRKKTNAEVAADDAQQAEAERKMLIMDERIKPAGAGAGANENPSAAASLAFTRFKTLELVRQRHEEAERAKKEEEARVALEKKQQEEQNAAQRNAAQQKQEQMAQRQHQMQLLAQQQQQQQQHQQQQPNSQSLAMQMRAEQMKAVQQARAQQAMMNAQSHGHPQQNGMLPNGQPGFQHANATSMPQSSPIVRQQTPMMNSSPMLAQGGFPMAQTSSQGAGSPARPTSGAMQNPMARQASQQHPGSRNNTPQIPQGTPGMVQAMPNRQPSQTPRMQPSSPAAAMQQGTPTSMSMPMQTPQMGNQMQHTPEQIQMMNAQRQNRVPNQANGQLHGASPMAHMTPDQVQMIRSLQAAHNTEQQQQMQQFNQARSMGNHQMAQNIQMDMQRKQAQLKMKQQAVLQHGQQQQLQQMNAQLAANAGQGRSPANMPQATPQMGHAHPQQQQQVNMQDGTDMGIADAQRKAYSLAMMRQNTMQQAQHQLQTLSQQYGGFNNIPHQALSALPVAAQQLARSQFARQQNARQQQALRAQAAQQQTQQQQQGATEQVPGGQPNPQYMQQLRNNQAMLAQAQQQIQNQQAAAAAAAAGGGNMNTLGMQSFTMGGGAFAASPGAPQVNMQPGGGGNDLSQSFAAMQNALTQPPQQQQGRPGGAAGGMQ